MITKRETDIYDDRCHWILESQIYLFKLTDTTRFFGKIIGKSESFRFHAVLFDQMYFNYG